ncbi:single-stranded-DNA-specific exonuclease RecJ [Candidatus Dependentiae bacterium]|jgi:single-stranded-DNA-specific exonuclease|nr:single-stranded-DNA-specific exonuclease RecJ [Candidatus Dependentiae bacterium]
MTEHQTSSIQQIPSSIATPPTTTLQGIKYLWKVCDVDQEAVRTLAYAHNLSFPIAHALCARGYTTPESVRAFLFSSFEQDVASGSLLKGAEIAATRIIKAVQEKEKILIFGDYDVDGATSSALMLAALIPLGAQINYHLPHREKEGYGLSVSAVQKAVRCGYKLIVTVDNGISALEAAQEAHNLGIDLIITDHHRPHGELPKALAIVNPNQDDCTYPFKKFAGVGVIFKIICLIYEQLGITTLPDKLYELLLLGTVADVVPLTGENRFWVKYGLNKINKQRSTAINSLIANSGMTKASLDSLDIGFMIAPQINALGRLDDSREAVRFLISSQEDEVFRIGAILKSMNEERKRIDREIYEEIEAAIVSKQINLDEEHIIVAASSKWPAGVIGLVAGKLMHTYGRPAILLHLDKKGLAKGSCRSIPEFNIFDALNANKDLLMSFGGHSCAAGLKLSRDLVPTLKKNLEDLIRSQIPLDQLRPKLTLDAPLELSDIDYKFSSDLAQLEPFGNQNPQPTFLVRGVTQLKAPELLKGLHLKCSVFADGVIKPVIFFNRPDLYKILKEHEDKPFSLACHIMKNEWQGVIKTELQGLDILLD